MPHVVYEDILLALRRTVHVSLKGIAEPPLNPTVLHLEDRLDKGQQATLLSPRLGLAWEKFRVFLVAIVSPIETVLK